MGRLLHAQTLIYDQLDFLSGSLRLSVPISQLEVKLFVNNQALPWTLEDGTSVIDNSISAGKIYYNEISLNPGYNSIRLFPDRVGFWRLIFKWLSTEIIKEYDVTSAKGSTGGMVASFTQ